MDSIRPGFVQVHEDQRRTIYQQQIGELLIQIFVVRGNPGEEQILGNDYHGFREDFVLVSGSGIVVLIPVDSDGNPVGERSVQTLDQRSIVRIGAGMAHAFRLVAGSQLMRVVDASVNILEESRRCVLLP